MGSRNKEFGVGEGDCRGQDIPREREEKKGLRTEPGEHGFLRGKKENEPPRRQRRGQKAGLKTRWRRQ